MKLEFNEKQKQTLDALKTNKKILNCGAIRSGKTIVMLWLIGFLCERIPGSTWLIGRKTYDAMLTDTIEVLRRNPGLWIGKGEWKDGGREFHFTGGSKVFFRHLAEFEHILGMTLAGAYLEQMEGLDEKTFDAIEGRLSQWSNKKITEYKHKYKWQVAKNKLMIPSNYMMATCNTHRGTWIKNKLIDNENSGWKTINYTIWDNKENLPANYIEELEKKSDEFKQIYLEGKWIKLKGLIYPEFSVNHIITGEIPNGKHYVTIDPGYQTSKFAVLYCCAADDKFYFYDEICYNGKDTDDFEKKTVAEIAKEIHIKNKLYGIEPLYLIDPSSASKSSINHNSVQDVFKEHKIYPKSANNERKGAIFKIKDLFKSDKIQIHERCSNIIEELGLYQWSEKNDEPLKINDDFCDAMRYFINANIINHKVMPKEVLTVEKQWAGLMDGFFKDKPKETINSISLKDW